MILNEWMPFGIESYPPEDSLKAHAQQRRGNEPRTRVGDGITQIPKSEWNTGFLKNEDNKKELFSFISWQICNSDMNEILLPNTHFFRRLTLTACLPTWIFMYQNFNHATRLMWTHDTPAFGNETGLGNGMALYVSTVLGDVRRHQGSSLSQYLFHIGLLVNALT